MNVTAPIASDNMTSSQEPFRGWRVVIAAFCGNFMATGTAFYIFNALMLPLCAERGWSRAELNYAPMLGFSLGLLFQLFYGSVIEKVGSRKLMTFGPALSAVAFICLGHTHNLFVFYLMYILLVGGNGTMNGVVANTAVANWFVAKRGKALGLATAGVSFSGVVLPMAAYYLLEQTTLENTFITVGLAILLVSPLSWLLVRDTPEACGQFPDGAQGPPDDYLENLSIADGDTHGRQLLMRLSASQLIRQADFWLAGLAFGVTLMGVVGVMFQLAPRFLDLGFDSRTGMIMVGVATFMGAVGKAAWGWVCDSFDPRKVISLMMVSNAAGLLIGLNVSEWLGGFAFAMVFGFAMGGAMSTFPIIVGYLYGRLAFASAFRFLVLFLGLEGLGSLIMGQSFEWTGSYDAAYYIFIGLDLLAAFMIMWVKKRSDH